MSWPVGIACGMLITAIHLAGLVTLTHTPSPMAFLNRILGTRVIDRDARQYMATDFDAKIEASFVDAFPRPRTEDEALGEIIGTVVSFEESGGRARALVRTTAMPANPGKLDAALARIREMQSGDLQEIGIADDKP